jgi:hypothetical protein
MTYKPLLETPETIREEIQKLQSRLKELESKIPKMKYTDNPMYIDLRLGVESIVKRCYLEDITLDDIDQDTKDSIVKHAIESFYGIISIIERRDDIFIPISYGEK